MCLSGFFPFWFGPEYATRVCRASTPRLASRPPLVLYTTPTYTYFCRKRANLLDPKPASITFTHGIPPDFRAASILVFKPSYAMGSVPSLSGHAIAYRWRSLPRVRRHRASGPQGSSSNGCCNFAGQHGQINVRLSFPTSTTVMKWGR